MAYRRKCIPRGRGSSGRGLRAIGLIGLPRRSVKGGKVSFDVAAAEVEVEGESVGVVEVLSEG